MGFLDKLLGKKEKEPRILELRFEEVEPFLKEKAGEKSSVIEKEVPAKFAEIKHLIRETKGLLNDLEKAEITEEGNKRLRKAVKTAKKDSIKKMNAVLQKIEPPFTSDAEKIRAYCHESLALLQEKVRSSGKSLAYTSIILKDTMRKIGKKIDSLEHSFKHLIETIKQNTILFEEKNLLALVSGIRADREELKKTELEIAELKKALEAIEKERDSKRSSLEKLLESDASKELRELDERKKKLVLEKLSLRDQLINTVIGISRPLKKLENMVKRGKYFLDRETEHAMRVFLEDPTKLFKQDPKAESFKLLLKELKGVIVSEKLDLKEREREKKLAEINTLLELDFFSNFFWKENELEKEIKEIEAKEKSIELKGEIDKIKRELKEIEHDYNETSSTLEELEKRAQELREKIRSSINSLSSMLSDLTSERIEIVEAKESEKSGVKTT